ncbi:filamentous hemagglutinin N-terminal domain-containing protein, partial [Scytonema sp. NUACC26]|uniref:two-partner secretion domain-containing protein n=1 Tax=Scytonema sp. NUACC26 TaxID=3140176 RepID=UPI0038B34E19
MSCWQLGFVGILSTVGICTFTCKALSQSTPSNIQPDNTLGIESSQILQNQNVQGLPVELIVGGATRGINLFHSFQEFNVTSGRGAYFLSPSVDIQNILARVTGGNRSEILGRLGTLSESKPNLFLINPNGMIFGEKASLDVQGSFVGTTANGLQFGNQGVFSAINPQAPALLSINPSALLFNQINQTAGITNRSLAPAGVSFGGDVTGLRVPDGKSLLLVSGNVTMDGGQLNAVGGRVELGGLVEPGSINLVLDSDRFSLKFPENVARADVLLSDRAFVFVEGAGGGEIAVNARNLEVSGGSIFFAGIGEGLGTPEIVAGDIVLNATGDIKIAGSNSQIRNVVRRRSKGNGGNIIIDSGSFSLREGVINASTFGQGNAGNVTVRAKDAVSLADAVIFTTVEAEGVGKGGNIDINAATLSLTDDAQLLTSTRSVSDNQLTVIGDAGNVNVKVTSTVEIAGRKNSFSSGIFSTVGAGRVGNGGNITIDSGSFSLRDSARIEASTFGQGNGGNVTVRALDAVSLADADIFSTVEASGVGKAGNIDINAATLLLTNSAQLLTITRGASNNQPAGRGDAGNVNVKVTGEVDIAGRKNSFSSGIRSSVESGTVGNGGNITIDSGSLSLRDGAQIATSTRGQGNAGNVTVRAKDVVYLAAHPTAIFSTVEATGAGKGGNIDINAATLTLRDGAQLLTSTRGASATQRAGRGDAGDVNVKVTGKVDIAGQKNGYFTSIFSDVETGTVGNGGDITINSGSFSLRDSARIDASTSGRGSAGNVTVQAVEGVSLAGASIFSTVGATGVGKGGNIDINAATLTLRDGAQLQTSTRSASDNQPVAIGDAGNVNVKVTGAVDIAGRKNGDSSGISSRVETGTVGNGGDITIDSGSFSLRDSAQITASTSGQGNGGDVIVRALDTVSLADAAIFSTVEPSGVGKGGNININAATLTLRDGAQLQTSTRSASDNQ